MPRLRKIMLVFGLLLLILQTAACVERFCSFTQSDPCYAALGHKLNLQMVNASKYSLTIIKRINNIDDAVCRVRNDTKRANVCDLYINRPEVRIIKGTVMINSVKREDSGNYRLELFNPDGTETSQYLQVNVEAPVGSVQVSIICSSNQMRSVSCSSEGDQLLYSWTLNGDTLMDGNSNIQLQEETKGEITCTVKNHVSQENTTVSIEDCPGLTTEAVTSSLTSTVTSSLTSTVTSSLLSTVSNNPTTSNCVSGWFVLVWFFQLMTLFALLGGFHIYIHTQVRKKNRSKLENTGRFREEHRAEDSTD
ncbi:uncharacterized protein isoform X1 [Danio rerio]|uniref:Uncharacterized protein isoform X1 n=2 Tax=Danio rerio TaxID=7955 RepID=A0A8M2BLN5_DANRE|nr:uncharacterized protein LOC101883913 [Danio rerio]|eukprot:XP_005174568.2 uncharacterized protein LOC101883913 [Danio rerio]